MRKRENIIAGLDIGNTKVCVVIGAINDNHEIDIIGVGTSTSRGIKKGIIVNIENAVNSIKEAFENALLMSGCTIDSIVKTYIGIADSYIKGINSNGLITIGHGEIKDKDIKEVMEISKVISIGADREIIHVIPAEFIVNDQDGVKDPLGMSGVRLEVQCHIVTAASNSTANVLKCAKQVGLNSFEIILSPLASSESVLTVEDIETGVSVIDIGGGTTDLALFIDGSLRYTTVIPLGGNNITNDIAKAFKTPFYPSAEEIKKKYGCALTSMVNKDTLVQIPSISQGEPQIVSQYDIASIIEPRVEEILDKVYREIYDSRYGDFLSSGLVMTGGGALLLGIRELAEKILEMPARIEKPKGVGGIVDLVDSPIYSTAVGLVLFGYKYDHPHIFSKKKSWFFGKFLNIMKGWFKRTLL